MRLHSAGVAQLVERNLAKVEVESSRLFSRSRILGESRAFPHLVSSPVIRAWRDGRVVMQRPAKPSTSVRFRLAPPAVPPIPKCYARMVKLVDTRDLKSLGASRTGSIPVPGTNVLRHDRSESAL